MSDMMREALEVVRLSAGWQSMSPQTKALIDAALAQQPAQGEAVGWLTDQGTFHFDKTDAWNDSEGFIEPLYTAPPAPAVPEFSEFANTESAVETHAPAPAVPDDWRAVAEHLRWCGTCAKKIPCRTNHQHLRDYYRRKLKYRIGFAACRVYCIHGREPTGRSTR